MRHLCWLANLSYSRHYHYIHNYINKLCARPHDMHPPLYAARCSPAPAHTRLTPVAPSAPCATNIHYRQAAARSSYDYDVVHIKYVVTWTANQSGLVTLTFWPWKWSRVTWATSVPILVFLILGLSVLELGPMYVTDVRQTDVRQKQRLMPPPIRGGGLIMMMSCKHRTLMHLTRSSCTTESDCSWGLLA